jgi:hypothetical protein
VEILSKKDQHECACGGIASIVLPTDTDANEVWWGCRLGQSCLVLREVEFCLRDWAVGISGGPGRRKREEGEENSIKKEHHE